MKWGKRNEMAMFCFLVFLAFGGLRFVFFDAQADKTISALNGKGIVQVQGFIDDYPDIRVDKILYKIELEEFLLGEKKIKSRSKILITSPKYPMFEYGDRLRINMKPQEPKNFEDFDYKNYLAKENIYSVAYYPQIEFIDSEGGSRFKKILFGVRENFKEAMEKNLGEPQSSLLAGLLLGEKKGFSDEFKNSLSLTGTSHIVSLSGYNISILALALIGFFNFLSLNRKWGFWLAVFCIVVFVAMTGAASSVVRAGIMGILVLIARQIGRPYGIKSALVFACAAMVWFNPKILVFDLGFQLSFLATLGLIYISPIFENWTRKYLGKPRNKTVKELEQIFCATIGAQIAVLPLILSSFGRFSLIAPLANLAVLFFIPATMFWGFAAGAAGIFWAGAGKIVSWIAWLFLSGEIKLIEIFAAFPLAGFDLKIGRITMVILYGIIIWRVIRIRNVDFFHSR